MKEGFVRFMTSPTGRVGRVLLGLILISVGLFVVQGTTGNVMALAALVPIAGGLFDFCLIAFVLGYPLSGSKARLLLHGK